LDPRDFISLTSFGTVGSILLGLGLLGCLLHREASRVLASAVVGLTGGLLILDGAQLFHGVTPAALVSLAVLGCGTSVALFLQTWRVPDPEPDNPPATVEKLVENQDNAANKTP
jgi:hypothetical protein